MIICSDNHYSNSYELKSNCWIKADPRFDGLRQIVYEPKNRIFIGNGNPDLHRENCINSITVEKDWFPQKTLPLNKGLVSIIGARGSGKTALLDFISLGANAHDDMCKAGFLYKAKEKIQSLKANISIDGKQESQIFNYGRKTLDNQLVKYLSQQFVENRCSDDGSTKLLQADIEHFIFDNIDEVDRYGTSNFSELKDVLFQHHESVINSYKNKISDLNKEIAKIYQLQTYELPIKQKEKNDKEKELKELEKKLPVFDKNVQNKSLDEYKTINDQKSKLESELKIEQAQTKELKQIYDEILFFNQTILEKNKNFKERLAKFKVDGMLLPEFNIHYPDLLIKFIDDLLIERKNRFNERFGDIKNPHEGTYNYLKDKLQIIQQEINAFTEKEKYYLDISNKINQGTIVLKEIDIQIDNIINLKKDEVQKERKETYQQIFVELLKEKAILESLYQPLVEQLKNNNKEKQLSFFVKTSIDVRSWTLKGEELIDLRKAKKFSDHEKLYEIAMEKLYPAWENCNPELLGEAINDFINKYAKEMIDNLLESNTLIDFADWLFSTDHIRISYELTFNEVPLKLLSPGTKGVLLMLLYLAVDKNDTRPLLIDQPEDNLDPESVYSVLVPYFVEAKKRRQIIMITHNPNLVVATDSDQVIVANMQSNGTSRLQHLLILEVD
jgi:ABC-type polar amino acid transport system ATPase subunit